LESEAEKIISFIFKRSGKNQLTKTEFYLSLSIDLKWYSPKKANDFIKIVIKNNLLIENNGLLKPNFNIDSISMPFGFKPSFNSLEYNDKEIGNEIPELFEIILKKMNYTSNKKTRLINDIKNICKEKNIYSNVATLLMFKEYNLKIDDYIKFAKQQIFN
jgi:hypothetical protein